MQGKLSKLERLAGDRRMQKAFAVLMGLLFIYPFAETAAQGLLAQGHWPKITAEVLLALGCGAACGRIMRGERVRRRTAALVGTIFAGLMVGTLTYQYIFISGKFTVWQTWFAAAWVLGMTALPACGFLLTERPLPSSLRPAILGTGLGAYFACALLFGLLCPVKEVQARLGILGGAYIVLAILALNRLAIGHAAGENAAIPRYILRAGRLMLIPLLIMGLVVMTLPLWQQGLWHLTELIGQGIGAAIGFIRYLIGLTLPAVDDEPGEGLEVEFEPGMAPEWLIRLLQIISGVLFVAVACLAVYGLYRLVYRWILGRKEKKDRRQWVEETGFTDEEEVLEREPRRRRRRRLYTAAPQKIWEDCQDDAQRLRLAYGHVKRRLAKDPAQGYLAAATPSEVARKARIEQVTKEELDLLAQGYNLARYSPHAAGRAQVEAAQRIYKRL
ncbi:hypothetical protein [Luoshenia tenuis]|uniref:hypothetical protein n=1 Tax=Luoshenia tenuis TaxID=2763654 RepID=UPI003D8AC4FE